MYGSMVSGIIGFMSTALVVVIILVVLIAVFKVVFIVQQQTEYIIERFGKFNRTAGAGIRFKIPIVERIAAKVDLRTRQSQLQIDGKTKDNVTITMQVARLRLGLSTDTVSGKLVQMARALQYERHYGKDDILEAYFNLAPYGGNVEGIGAAARIYFHVSPARLSLSESLALAAVPQNPVRRSPLNGPDFESARARMTRLALPERQHDPEGMNASFAE